MNAPPYDPRLGRLVCPCDKDGKEGDSLAEHPEQHGVLVCLCCGTRWDDPNHDHTEEAAA